MKRKLSIIISIIVVIGLILGVTLALIRKNIFNQNIGFNISGLDAYIIYSKGTDILTGTLDPVSIYSDTAMNTEITLYKNTSKTIYGHIYLDLTTISSTLAAEPALKWVITSNNTILNQGNFTSYSQGDSIPLKLNIPLSTTEQKFQIYVWLDDNMDINDELEGLTLSTSVRAEASEKGYSSLPAFIKNSNAPLDSVNSTYVQNSTPGIDFTQVSSDTNGKGLYIRSGTENDVNPIYYYRGAVDNNNVYFANYCWKIVRTTDTGGLKMIYNGAPTSGSCGTGTTSQTNSKIANSAFNTNYNDAKYVGYTYDNSGTETDSTIKGVIDTWYQNNILTSYDSYIEDTVYCNDREEVTAQEKTQIETAMGLTFSKLYKSAVRIMNTTPSLECTNNADKYTKSNTIGNGKLTYTVGLLAMDEIWIAGVGLDGMNGNWANPASYYLYSGSYWWSLSPIGLNYGIVSVMGVCNNYGLYYCYVNSSNIGARPVISLKPEHNTFEYGNGSGANPYRLEATVPSN